MNLAWLPTCSSELVTNYSSMTTMTWMLKLTAFAMKLMRKIKYNKFEKWIEDNITHFQSSQHNTLLQRKYKLITSKQLSKLIFNTTISKDVGQLGNNP